jgi:hypothetical protein
MPRWNQNTKLGKLDVYKEEEKFENSHREN